MALAEISPNTKTLHRSSTSGEAWANPRIFTSPALTSSSATSFPPPVPPLPLSLLGKFDSNNEEGEEDDGLKGLRKRGNRNSLPALQHDDFVNKAPGIADRRKSSRSKSIYIERVGGLGVAGQTGSRSPKSPRPRFPIKLESTTNNSVPTLATQLVASPTSLLSPTVMTSPYEATTPPDTAVSESFEDAPETSSSAPDTPKAADVERKSSMEDVTLKENGDGQSLPATEAAQLDEKEQSGSDATSSKATHSRSNTQDNVPVMPAPETSRSRSTSPAKRPESRDEDVKRTSIISSSTLRSASRTGSPSPTRAASRAQSPPKLSRAPSNDAVVPAARPPSTRSTSSKFGGFLSRMSSIRNPAKSPPPIHQERSILDRRNTSQSISSLASNGEHLATIEDGAEESSQPKRPSLQAQFLTLRKQGQDPLSPNGSLQLGDDNGVNGQIEHLASPVQDRNISPPPLTPALKSPLPDPNLPPGTASGLTAGPAEEPRPVDWDLWQAVVCEGPVAVARTSGEELNRAIASGIPAAIRGVVWQVLADSKSPELEDLYRTLRDRSVADIEQQQPPLRPSTLVRDDSQLLFQNANDLEKESDAASSSASVRSDKSGNVTPLKSTHTSPPPSVLGDDTDSRARMLTEKTKREAAALSKLEKAIKRDLGSRTSFSKYTQAAGLQDGLFGLCKAYALFDEAVGYAQGINFIAMPLLFNASEEEAFTLLVRLMSKYDVRNLFNGDMSGLHLRLYQFERLLEDNDPALYCHLRRRNVAPALYATQWFLTLFAYRFPLQLVLRVYDLIFSQGLVAILKFGLVLLEHNRDALLDMKDMGQLTNFLKEKVFDVYIDKSPSASSLLEGGFFGSVSGGADKELYRADEMVRDACAVEITELALATYTAEWEEQQRKDADTEALRTTNTTLTSRLKALEERTQQQDLEHVTIAGEVVRIKVENDRLQDENEGLKMKVEELQRLVDTQPAEIEARFQEEMERVLQRNSEVQSENRVLKEEQEEMERQMVDVKMKHAQTLQDHETLTQRWASMRDMFNSK